MRFGTHAAQLLIALVLGQVLTPKASRAQVERAYLDIVQVDTGSTDNFTGLLKLQSNCYPCWHVHGTQMAQALNHEVGRQTRTEVRAVQLVWRTSPDIPSAILRAVSLNPRVISLSLAGAGQNPDEYRALVTATEAGVLVLAAAGNNSQSEPQYPAAYRLPCLLAVSTHIDGVKDPVANAGDIYYPKFWPEAGTSFSTARMAAVAAAYYQKHPYATCHQAEAHLREKFSLHTRF